MIHKGYRFRISHRVLPLPFDKKHGHTVQFGRVCSQTDKGAVATHYRHPETREVLFAKPITMTGYSTANMAYGADGRVYLCFDARCYIARNTEYEA